MEISDSEAQEIARCLDLRTEPGRADLVFVFGTKLPDPAYLAAGLLPREAAKMVVLTGGDNRHTGDNEARRHLKVLVESGVSEDRIIVEDRSTNTLENVAFALPKIAERMSMDNIRSIVAVTKWYHSRRALMTLKRHFMPGIRYLVESYEPAGVRRHDWWLDHAGSSHVLKEWQRIPDLLERDHIAEVVESDGSFM